MHTTSTLTERYIAATITSLSPQSQDDVRAELTASIDDAVEARVEQGEERTDAERAVLTALGDPGVLAARYADRPLHLIGPEYYLTWWRLLKLLLIIVPVCAMAGVAIGQTIANASIGEVIGSAVTTGLMVIVHVSFWVTLVFVVLERTGADTGTRWNVDQLPEPQPDGVGRADLIASLVFLGAAAGAVLWDRFRGFVRPEGEAVPVLHPDLWPWWISGLFLLMGLEAALAIAVYVRRRWTIGLAAANTLLAVLFVGAALALLASGALINPEFLELVTTAGGQQLAEANVESAEQGGVLRILAVLTGVGIVAAGVWDVFDGWRKTARARGRA